MQLAVKLLLILVHTTWKSRTQDIAHSDIGHLLGLGPAFDVEFSMVSRVRVLDFGLASHGSATFVSVHMCECEYPSNLTTIHNSGYNLAN